MFLLEKDRELTPRVLGSIINDFQKSRAKMEHYYKYYKGDQAILHKPSKDYGKPDPRIVVNHCATIVSNYMGYLIGKDIKYMGDNLEQVIEVLNYNDVHYADSELLKNALIMGRGVELLYIDESGKVRFKPLDPKECIDVYDDTLDNNLLYGIRFYKADYAYDIKEKYYVEVYDSQTYRKYESWSGFSDFKLIEEKPHYFNQVPMNFFDLNVEQDSIFDKIITLQDAYNEMISNEVADFDSFCDAYLIFKGETPSEDDLNLLREKRAICINETSDVSYLTKSINDTQVENILSNLDNKIHTIANSPNFADEAFGTSSGIALKYKLLGFENVSGSIESLMKKALQRRIELICSIISLVNTEVVWRDVDIVFTRNLPVDLKESAEIVNSLRGLVSDETLLSLLPFVKNPTAELEKINKQKAENMAIYNFSNLEEEEDE